METTQRTLLVATATDFLTADVAPLAGPFTIERAAPGAPALRRFSELRPAWVVLDATLPGLRGAYLLAALQATAYQLWYDTGVWATQV